MERLTPPERAVFVLREAFELPYEQIAEIVGCSLANAASCTTAPRRAWRGPRPLPAIEIRDGRIHGLYGLLNPDKLSRIRST
ncbi:sigma factor-like helix-turn-helix DNA-binding protein [Nonomuraea aurantiaca]|uniref:sigma factor-like helix-turn-helix DNA-binding protein n=1 Tax=Nonomuraea aurantiaca TaxID=2878562 RepID=UPI0027E0ACA0|nr:sigma factor-like helix-turn-helix DNA-binding protein [Nonomuraea aurantiaca]